MAFNWCDCDRPNCKLSHEWRRAEPTNKAFFEWWDENWPDLCPTQQALAAWEARGMRIQLDLNYLRDLYLVHFPRPLSCLLCGHVGEMAVMHEPSGVWVCMKCRDAAKGLPHIDDAWRAGFYTCIEIAAQKCEEVGANACAAAIRALKGKP